MPSTTGGQTPENVRCPDCGGPMQTKTSEWGVFWGCLQFPACRGTRDEFGRSKAEREAVRARRDKDETPEQHRRSRRPRWRY